MNSCFGFSVGLRLPLYRHLKRATGLGRRYLSEENNNPRVLVEKRDSGIAVVSLNRPFKKNALDMKMFQGLRDAAIALSSDTSVRAVILRGVGDAFCSGLDVKSVIQNPLNLNRLLERPKGRLSNLAQDVSLAWRGIPAPVIAVTQGACLGGGLQIALGADFRFSHPDCKFSVMEAKWGLIPDMGGSVLLRELVSIDVAKELTMTARIFDGNAAKGYGLVTHVTNEPMEGALALAEEISARSPDCVAAAKVLFNRTWHAPVRESLEIESELQCALLVPPLKNTLAAASMGMELPIQLSFKERQDHWSEDS